MIPHMKMTAPIFLAALLWWAFISTACTARYLIANEPFVPAAVPAEFQPLPLKVAVVRTEQMQRIPVDFGEKEELDRVLAEAAMRGLLAAAGLVFQEAVLLDAPPAAGVYDMVFTPTNPYLELGKNEYRELLVTITFDVIVQEAGDTKERRMLLEGQGRTGKRPVVPVKLKSFPDGPKMRVGVTGALLYDTSPLEQALNNALFRLSLNFAKELHRRGMRLLESRQTPA